MRKGFTLVELLVIMGIVSLLVSFVVISILKPQSSSSLSSTTNQLISDVRSQQLKSMVGETGTIEASPSGVFFGPTSYTLFYGGNFQNGDPNNFVINLPDNVRFSTVSFPGSKVVFATRSGEIVGFSTGTDSVTISWNNSAFRTIRFNKYGSAISVN